jgi:hypothetical protein
MDGRGPWRLLRWQAGALFGLLVVFGGAGFFLWDFTARYEASTMVVLPNVPEVISEQDSPSRQPSAPANFWYPGGPAFFRQIEPILESAGAIETFASSRGLTGDPAITRFLAQVRAHRTEPVSFAFGYSINRADIRDLPDALSSEILKNSQIRFSIIVRASDRSEAGAVHANKIFVDYVRDQALHVALTNTILQFLQYARVEGAKIEADQISIQTRLASIDRQVADLDRIRGEYAEWPNAGTDIVSVPRPPARDVRRFLSPVRQLVALQAERSELKDREVVARSKRSALGAVDRYVGAVQARAGSEPKAIVRLETAFKLLDSITTTSDSTEEKLATTLERASINEKLMWLRTYFLDQPPEPAEPIVYRGGPSRSAVVGGAMLFAFIIWLVVARGALRGLLR